MIRQIVPGQPTGHPRHRTSCSPVPRPRPELSLSDSAPGYRIRPRRQARRHAAGRRRL